MRAGQRKGAYCPGTIRSKPLVENEEDAKVNIRCTAALVLAGVLAFAGCGQEGAKAEVTTTTAPNAVANSAGIDADSDSATGAEPMSFPAPVLMTKDEAAAKYLELVGPGNAASTEKAGYIDAEQYVKACQATLPAEEALNRSLSEVTNWPNDVAPLVAQLVALQEAELNSTRTCASASERDAETILYGELYDAIQARQVMSKAIRSLLGLPQIA
jgi:hypothetical protein